MQKAADDGVLKGDERKDERRFRGWKRWWGGSAICNDGVITSRHTNEIGETT
jgi:hypothetical protein